MARIPTAILAGIALLLALAPLRPAAAQKSGGVLKVQFFDSPASMSIHEESTIAGQGPMMGVFNNLATYDQHVPQNSLHRSDPPINVPRFSHAGHASEARDRRREQIGATSPVFADRLFLSRDIGEIQQCSLDSSSGPGDRRPDNIGVTDAGVIARRRTAASGQADRRGAVGAGGWPEVREPVAAHPVRQKRRRG
jgi:hypothetical protein